MDYLMSYSLFFILMMTYVKIRYENKHILQVFDAKCLIPMVSKVKNFLCKFKEHYFLLDKLYYFYKSENYRIY